jgi:hypothetical protein
MAGMPSLPPSPPDHEAAELQEQVSQLSGLAEKRARLQEESVRMDTHLMLLNTVLWMKKLQHYSQGKRKQPFHLTLTCPLGPSSSSSSISLSLVIINSTPVALCTPFPLCVLVVLFDFSPSPFLSSFSRHLLSSLFNGCDCWFVLVYESDL